MCLRSSSSCLRLLPRLPFTSIFPFILPSVTCFRRQFLRKVWPIQLAFLLSIVSRILLFALTLTRLWSKLCVEASWNVMTHAETTFCLSPKRTSPFKSVGASVQSTTGCRGVHISCSNGGYTMFRGNVKGTGCPLHSPVSPSLPFPCVTVCHHISTWLYEHVYWHFLLTSWIAVSHHFIQLFSGVLCLYSYLNSKQYAIKILGESPRWQVIERLHFQREIGSRVPNCFTSPAGSTFRFKSHDAVQCCRHSTNRRVGVLHCDVVWVME